MDNKTNNNDSKFFNLEVYTPTDLFLSCKVKSVTVPSPLGSFQILTNHAPILVSIDAGTATYIDSQDQPHILFVEKGIVEAKNNNTVFTVESAERIEDIEVSALEQLVNEANLALTHTNLKDITRVNTNRKIELIKRKIKAVQNSA